MQDPHTQALALLQSELATQDTEWNAARDQLLNFGDVELSIDAQTIAELEEATQPKIAGAIPMGFTRA